MVPADLAVQKASAVPVAVAVRRRVDRITDRKMAEAALDSLAVPKADRAVPKAEDLEVEDQEVPVAPEVLAADVKWKRSSRRC